MATSMKEHLAGFHKRASTHHTIKAASHATRAAHFQKLAAHFTKTEVTEAEKDAQSILAALAAEHEEMSAEHSDLAGFHADCQEKCAKAADGDLNKLVPTQISAVAPTPPNVRAIPRTGMREVPTAVEPALEKLLGTDPTNWHEEEQSLRQ